MSKVQIDSEFFKARVVSGQVVYAEDFEQVLHRLEFSPELKFLWITDPPFNIGYHYNEHDDSMPMNEYISMLSLIPSPRVIIHYPEPTINILPHAFGGELVEKCVQWVYPSNNQKQHRTISFWGIKPDFNRVKQPYKNPNDKRIKQLIANGSEGARSYDWWNINQIKNTSSEKTAHPCQMPVKIFENIIKLCIPENERSEWVVVDPFTGSGSSGVAAVNLGVKFLGFEKDHTYYDIASKRIREARGDVDEYY